MLFFTGGLLCASLCFFVLAAYKGFYDTPTSANSAPLAKKNQAATDLDTPELLGKLKATTQGLKWVNHSKEQNKALDAAIFPLKQECHEQETLVSAELPAVASTSLEENSLAVSQQSEPEAIASNLPLMAKTEGFDTSANTPQQEEKTQATLLRTAQEKIEQSPNNKETVEQPIEGTLADNSAIGSIDKKEALHEVPSESLPLDTLFDPSVESNLVASNGDTSMLSTAKDAALPMKDLKIDAENNLIHLESISTPEVAENGVKSEETGGITTSTLPLEATSAEHVEKLLTNKDERHIDSSVNDSLLQEVKVATQSESPTSPMNPIQMEQQGSPEENAKHPINLTLNPTPLLSLTQVEHIHGQDEAPSQNTLFSTDETLQTSNEFARLPSKIELQPLQETTLISDQTSTKPELNRLNVSSDANDLFADLNTEWIQDAFDTQEENFIEGQTGDEFSYRKDSLFQNRSTVAQRTDLTNPEIRSWLHKQQIQGIAYKGMESCLILNSKIFHVGDLINPELNVTWTDIDPQERKLYFVDERGVSYTAKY